MTAELYRQYGDKRTITAFYPGLKKYMDYMKDKGLPGRGIYLWSARWATGLPLRKRICS